MLILRRYPRLIQHLRYARNGFVPEAPFQGRLNHVQNHVMAFRRKTLMTASAIGGTPRGAAGTTVAYQFRCHVGHGATHLAFVVGMGLSDVPGSDPIVRIKATIAGGAATSLDLHGGNFNGTPVDAPSEIAWRDGKIAVTANTTYEVAISVVDYARIVGVCAYELASDVANAATNYYAVQAPGVGFPVWDSIRQTELVGMSSLWRRNGSHLMTWPGLGGTASPTFATTSWTNAIDLSPTAAALTWYMTNALVSVHQEMSETSPGADATSSPATGWTVSTGSTNYSPMDSNVTQTAATFTSTVQPDGSIDTTVGDCMRSTNTYNGGFASGNWTINGVVIAVANGGSQDGTMGFRLFRSVNANGSSATEITGAVQTGATVTDLTAATQQNSSITFNPGAFSVADEYLFVQIGWQRTGAGAMTTSDVIFRVGSTATRVVTSTFTPNATGIYLGDDTVSLVPLQRFSDGNVSGTSLLNVVLAAHCSVTNSATGEIRLIDSVGTRASITGMGTAGAWYTSTTTMTALDTTKMIKIEARTSNAANTLTLNAVSLYTYLA